MYQKLSDEAFTKKLVSEYEDWEGVSAYSDKKKIFFTAAFIQSVISKLNLANTKIIQLNFQLNEELSKKYGPIPKKVFEGNETTNPIIDHTSKNKSRFKLKKKTVEVTPTIDINTTIFEESFL